MAKALIVAVLGWQVRRLQKKNTFKVIAVVGSIGKTSTKFSIAQVLGQSLQVRYQEGNYNDLVSVPLVFFGQTMPSLFNPLAWLKIFVSNNRQLKSSYPFDAVVIELGTDGPGQIAAFKRYVTPDIAVLTAIAPEHMQFFNDLPHVAQEELSVAQFSKQLLVNTDLCAAEFTVSLSAFKTYAKNTAADYKLTDVVFSANEGDVTIAKEGKSWISASHSSFAEPQLYSLVAAAAVADILGLTTAAISDGFKNIRPVSGRMQRLNGIKQSVIIDDSYNASPEAAKAALDTLYRIEAPQKIAVLGNMNELGTFSEAEHTKIGEYCDPKKLVAVLTIGQDANTYLAAAAEKRGCTVERFESPYAVGRWLNDHIEEGALVLVKGSQNKVYAKEAIKPILADQSDQSKLVRQSEQWLKIKHAQFGEQAV